MILSQEASGDIYRRYGVHNGNLVNALKLKDRIQRDNKRHINSTSDSEILLNVFADCLSQECGESDDLSFFYLISYPGKR